jgi:hypothetical protein
MAGRLPGVSADIKRFIGFSLAETLPKKSVRRCAWWVSHAQALFCSRILRRRVIFVIGDSHTQIFRWEKPFVVFALGPATAYNLGNSRSTTGSHDKLFHVLKLVDPERDSVLMVFGEIDARMHVYNQYMKQGAEHPFSYYIDRTIEKYGEVLEQLTVMGIDFYVHGIPPASRQEIMVDPDSSLAFYAPREIRSEISRTFNQRLKEYCEVHGYRYIDIYSRVVDENGQIAEAYRGDAVHMNHSALPFFKECMRLKQPS